MAISAPTRTAEGWMQYAAALGNGIASYELAVYYRRQEQPVPAAQYETRARDLGYTPPSTLDNVRK
jgi:TPR repeat protein